VLFSTKRNGNCLIIVPIFPNWHKFSAMRQTFDLILFGANTDASGLPQPFHRYRIEVSDWIKPGSSIATILPTTVDCPRPEQSHFISHLGGCDTAARLAREALEQLPGNAGLQKHGNCP